MANKLSALSKTKTPVDFAARAIALLEWILYREYKSEFVIVYGTRKHPDGLSFEQWLDRHYDAARSAGK
jgi:hypothetical protein